VFCVSVKVKLTVSLLCVCVHFAWKGRPRNDLYCVGWDVKPYSLTHLLTLFDLRLVLPVVHIERRKVHVVEHVIDTFLLCLSLSWSSSVSSLPGFSYVIVHCMGPRLW